MRQPKPITGARALLFDRLADLHSEVDEGERPFRILNRDQLKASVRRELGRLLNTRCSLSLHQVGEEERSVVNYGIPDFSSLSPHHADDRALIASIIGQTITAFEPRLRQVRVEVEPREGSQNALWVQIEAVMSVGQFNEPVSFPVLFDTKRGDAKVHDGPWSVAKLLAESGLFKKSSQFTPPTIEMVKLRDTSWSTEKLLDEIGLFRELSRVAELKREAEKVHDS